MAASNYHTTGKNFYIFGSNISFSKSPILHQTAFKHHKLPYTYEIHQTSSVEPLVNLIDAASFGGASVTMPHKLSISTCCSEISSHAEIIRAISTLVVVRDRTGKRIGLKGDNSDWSGLVSCLDSKGKDVLGKARTGLVIGAGGASRAALYALFKLGIRDIYLVNRTQSNADRTAQEFSALFPITVLPNLKAIEERRVKPEIIIGTIPADVTSVEDLSGSLFAAEKGICVDMAYKPRNTPLLKIAMGREGWATVTGVEVLLAQAFVQSEWWLELPAPRQEMLRALEVLDLRSEAREGVLGVVGKL